MITRTTFVAALVGRQLVRHVAECLDPQGIPIMPLKGVLLQVWVYPDAATRPISDVDVLVRPDDYLAAQQVLASRGYRRLRTEAGDWQSVWRHPELPLDLDLHRRLARTRRHRLTPPALFAEGHPNEHLFGARVIVPDPLDLYAHLLAHASSTLLLGGYLHRPEDMTRVPEALSLEPRIAAAHLVRRGVGRHARLVLPLIQERMADPFGQEVLRFLPRDPFGRVVAATARLGSRRAGGRSALRRVPGLLLNPTLAEAGLALAGAARDRIRSRVDPTGH